RPGRATVASDAAVRDPGAVQLDRLGLVVADQPAHPPAAGSVVFRATLQDLNSDWRFHRRLKYRSNARTIRPAAEPSTSARSTPHHQTNQGWPAAQRPRRGHSRPPAARPVPFRPVSGRTGVHHLGLRPDVVGDRRHDPSGARPRARRAGLLPLLSPRRVAAETPTTI